MKRFILLCTLVLSFTLAASAQYKTDVADSACDTLTEEGTFNLSRCLHYAIENNQSLQKDRLSLEQANLSKREVVGAWLPQINASASFTGNIQKTQVAMPNFMNMILPEPDPNADAYMIIPMGMDVAPNFGASLAQQVLNLSLVNAVKIADSARQMAQTGLTISTDEVITQTATLYYNIQVLEYAVSRFEEVISLMDRTLRVMEANHDAGLMRDVDVKRITVTKTNLESERSAISTALEVQKRLIKLQMGYPMEEDIALCSLDENEVVNMVYSNDHPQFDVTILPAFKMMKNQQDLLGLQYKSAVYSNLPVIALVGNASMNYMWNINKADSFHQFPMSMVSLSLKMPIFTGGSNTAKVKKAKVELAKSQKDEETLVQALSMSYFNSKLELERTLKTVETQIGNKELAKEVYDVTENNFTEGISSLTDVLNASSSLVQAEVNFSTALNNCIKAYIDLKRAEGTIGELVK